MKTLIVNLLKLACLVAYAAALATTLGWMSSTFGSRMQIVAPVLLGLHVLELGLAWKHLRRYPGPLAVSVLPPAKVVVALPIVTLLLSPVTVLP